MNMNALQTFFLANKIDAKKTPAISNKWSATDTRVQRRVWMPFWKGRRLQSDHREHATLSKQEGKTKHNVPD